MKTKKIFYTTIFTLIIICMFATKTQAYQSIPRGMFKEETSINWQTNIRNMESKDQGLGLNEEIEEGSLLTLGNGNDIDVHMQKNTEYGAVLLLGTSDYGKKGTNDNSDTSRYMHKGECTLTGTGVKASSTGNVYGVFELGSSTLAEAFLYEFVSAYGKSSRQESKLSSAVARYSNNYGSKIKGDEFLGGALKEGNIEILSWQDTGNSISALDFHDNYTELCRGTSKKAFNAIISNNFGTLCSRAVIVVAPCV